MTKIYIFLRNERNKLEIGSRKEVGEQKKKTFILTIITLGKSFLIKKKVSRHLFTINTKID